MLSASRGREECSFFPSLCFLCIFYCFLILNMYCFDHWNTMFRNNRDPTASSPQCTICHGFLLAMLPWAAAHVGAAPCLHCGPGEPTRPPGGVLPRPLPRLCR